MRVSEIRVKRIRVNQGLGVFTIVKKALNKKTGCVLEIRIGIF